MTDYVLIHGAWHGSWCWARVRRLLAAGAHRVFTPTLTGVGERSHLLSRDVGLDTHVADVANLMIWENLRDNAADAAWVDRQCTMHPLSSFEAPAQISGACDDIAKIGYILASGFEGPFGQFYAKAGERRWWQEELACGHDVMLDMPNELTALLLQRT